MNSNSKARISTFCSVVASGLLLLGCATSACAASPTDPKFLSKVVDYSDLNLRTGAGAKTLYARIRDAAKDVCAPLASSQLAAHASWQNCVDQAIDGSVARVNSSMVTALHNDATKSARKG